MSGSRVRNRFIWVSLGALLAAGAVLLIVFALPGQLNAFRTPTQLAALDIPPGKSLRLGGQIVPGSYTTQDGITHVFTLTDKDGGTQVVSYSGALPDLFREGQGIIATGVLDGSGGFDAKNLLTKHDEAYVPRELRDHADQQQQGTAGQ
ncbi:MAG: cytochrome c maturation protein CcmE [Alphaproteobacteria bacterium]